MNKVLTSQNDDDHIERFMFEIISIPINEQKCLFKKYEKVISKSSKKKLIKALLGKHPFLATNLVKYFSKTKFSEHLKTTNYFRKTDDQSLALSALRMRAKDIPNKKTVIFCQPKSGSSFATDTISRAFNLRYKNLNTFSYAPTNFGINGREQELCELSLLKAIFQTKKRFGFVAQHHTKANQYLINQIDYFGLKPIILTRNIFDALISLHDMVFKNHQLIKTLNIKPFIYDGFQTIPENFIDLPFEKRLQFLTRMIGPWYVNFYLSWKRFSKFLKDPICWITYEDTILNTDKFVNIISDYLGANQFEIKNLYNALNHPDYSKSLFNKGIKGRGDQIDQSSKQFLIEYALIFNLELEVADYKHMFGKDISF